MLLVILWSRCIGIGYEELSANCRRLILRFMLQGSGGRAIARELQRGGDTAEVVSEGGLMRRTCVTVGCSPLRTDVQARRELRRFARAVGKPHCRLPLWRTVRAMLEQHWSPGQFASAFKCDNASQPTRQARYVTTCTPIYAMLRQVCSNHLDTRAVSGERAHGTRAGLVAIGRNTAQDALLERANRRVHATLLRAHHGRLAEHCACALTVPLSISTPVSA